METKEGFYRLVFSGTSGAGVAVMVLDSGMVVGADTAAVIYDGTYQHDPKSDELELDLKVIVPPGVAIVQGIPALAMEHKFWVRARIPRRFTGTQVLDAESQFGPVKFRLTKIRDFPPD